ncbi:MAG: putative GNAT family N-acyltransferase [Natronomonas sp.]|jgi:predicted GNAT family N-acyltransferase|uniref:GNAT family N-acetyltransferase n=1 Tax=Natronomonas sp. TaxID=2184060 RepID=UPI003989E2D9
MDVRRVESETELEDALTVRRAVFIEEQGVPEHRELDGKDETATNFVAYDGDQPVGAARLREYDDAAGKVERVAVLEARRGEGLGREIMDAVEAAAKAAGCEAVVLHAQVPVVEFYDRLGYEVMSEEFEDAGIPHREMRKSL